MKEKSRELRVLRAMAWERAKGELNAMLHTYYPLDGMRYDQFSTQLHKFIRQIEQNGLHE